MEKLSSPDMPAQEMNKWLQALKLCVCHLDQDCDLLVIATLVSALSSCTQHTCVTHVQLHMAMFHGGHCLDVSSIETTVVCTVTATGRALSGLPSQSPVCTG